MQPCFSALIIAGLAAGVAPAQEAQHKTTAAHPGQGQSRAHAGEMSLALPTGDRATSSLLVEAVAPARIVAGKPYEYQIKLTNLTANLVLEQIAVRQDLGEHLAIERSEPAAVGNDTKGQKSWVLARLGPGESSTIRVQALGDRVGASSSCIRVTYQPSLCLTTEFVKPEVEVTKEIPARGDLCDVIPARYVVRNTGTGEARGLKLRDELPEGLTTTSGAKVVEADLGEIGQGQSKEVKVELTAARPGDYTSRAAVQGQDGLRATSNQPTTALRQAKLDVKIAGPDAQYLGQASTYRVTVRNAGEIPAVAGRLQVRVDADLRIDRVSRATSDSKAPAVGADNSLTWDLGDLAPGAESVVSFTGVSRGKKELTHTATASSTCARSREPASTATATAQTEIISLPALRLEMVDDHDPIRVGENVIYTINVLNQGQGDDRNVRIVCKLPGGLTYVSSTGPTQGKADGGTITFGAVDRLAPKQQINFTVVAKATKAGDVRTGVELTSEYLTTPDTETEPTRLID